MLGGVRGQCCRLAGGAHGVGGIKGELFLWEYGDEFGFWVAGERGVLAGLRVFGECVQHELFFLGLENLVFFGL